MENKEFKIQSYGITELAKLYRPFVQDQSARRTLENWIKHNPDLQKALAEMGYKGSNMLTPKQVAVIVEYLGDP